MTGLDELLVELLDRLPGGVTDPETGLVLRPVEVELDLPIETRLRPGGALEASLPRGRFDVGFRYPVSRLRARCTSAPSGEGA